MLLPSPAARRTQVRRADVVVLRKKGAIISKTAWWLEQGGVREESGVFANQCMSS